MMHGLSPTQPIGIFDSGLGGLTVASAIARQLPHENMVYFGDTAHYPWGDKSAATVEYYATKITEVLLKHHCKAIVVACNTASALALPAVQALVPESILICNVIDPVVDYLVEKHPRQTIGLIGTKQTILSQSYQNKIFAKQANIRVQALPTPLLVPLIEEGFAHKPATKLILDEYLSTPELLNIEALILGCTHYPLLKAQIDNFYDHHVDIVDSAQLGAEHLKHRLTEQGLLNPQTDPAHRHFYVSDCNPIFEKTALRFFGEPFHLELFPLWM